jgi:hypothetical protein
MNPDSAVAIGKEVRGTILPQRSRWVCASEPAIAQRCFNGSFKPHSDVVRERKITLKFHSRAPSLLQDSTSLPAFLVPTAESGMNINYERSGLGKCGEAFALSLKSSSKLQVRIGRTANLCRRNMSVHSHAVSSTTRKPHIPHIPVTVPVGGRQQISV